MLFISFNNNNVGALNTLFGTITELIETRHVNYYLSGDSWHIKNVTYGYKLSFLFAQTVIGHCVIWHCIN